MAKVINISKETFTEDQVKTRCGIKNAAIFFKEFTEPSEEAAFIDTFVNLSGKMFHIGPSRSHFNVIMARNDIEMVSEYMCKARLNRRGERLVRYAREHGGRVPTWIQYLVNYSLIW